ncbi:heavy metal translocating P-type ATPase [Thiohalophilus sp.]|uniref:heavy metal translocating P-type ATPase n=1 Tax=Thiohalophilus sp. TaxID=3028392 RepID=UPI002ACE19B0|nr:heavy metal translocating P-type ATPase [Thiohalophilus sp.]MDZ7661763.1 heavy metal translocating P-type ATPase [Thiohalophilus sp.]
MVEQQHSCFHCGQPVPPGSHYQAVIDGQARPMCCPGCEAVANAIVEAGLADFYRYRTDNAPNPSQLVPDVLETLDLYDRPEVQQRFVSGEPEEREAALILEGITCAACVWLSERHVGRLPGVLEFSVNYSTQRARVRWDERQIHLSDILKAISAIGYLAHPYDPQHQARVHQRERGRALRRLAVAGLGMMQVMMLAVALYAGEDQGMSPEMMHFLRWVSLVIATPVVWYSGWPFFSGAWRDLRQRRLGMDVPVALAVSGTYLASLIATVSRSGEVYFESATMFVFFLLLGRFLEMGARQRASAAVESLATLLPALATRLEADGSECRVGVAELVPGDRVRIRPGETVPADGEILRGISSVDESLLTGESLPRARRTGEALIGGAVNVESPLEMRVTQVGQDTVLSGIQRLLDRAQSEKPRIARLAERGTGWFVLGVLLLAAGAALVWWQIEPMRAFWVAVAVLVVSCPCALALATPVAMTASTGQLTRRGVITTRGHALETLARIDTLVFDKTGTLTQGELRLEQVMPLGTLPAARCHVLAAALEQGSEHPLAKAIVAEAPQTVPVEQLQATPGRGVAGEIDGIAYRLGNLDFVRELSGAGPVPQAVPGQSAVYLGSAKGLLAALTLSDQLRPEAAQTVAGLIEQGIEVQLFSGDEPATVQRVAEQLGIAQVRGGLLPADKLAGLRELQAQGRTVAMVGDGVNDAPVLSQAHVSIAMASGVELARNSADMILQANRLSPLLDAVVQARATRRIIHQNIGWALGYNLVALPVAAAGLLTPWLAALGMSLSSLLVVLNALRLLRHNGEASPAPAARRRLGVQPPGEVADNDVKPG